MQIANRGTYFDNDDDDKGRPRHSSRNVCAKDMKALLHHGLRTLDQTPLTADKTSQLADVLRRSNDQYAVELSQRIESRFPLRFILSISSLDDVRAGQGNENLNDVQCFLRLTETKLSPSARQVWQKARARHAMYDNLLATIVRRNRRNINRASLARLEADQIKALVEFEVKNNRADAAWSFMNGGLDLLVNDFFLLKEHLANYSDSRLEK